MQPPLKRLSTGTGQQEGQRMQDVDENFGRVEQAIDTLNANTKLLWWTGKSSQSVLDIIQANYGNLPNFSMRNVIITRGWAYGAIVFKTSNTAGKVLVFGYDDTGLTIYRLLNGTWTERTI